MEDSDIVAEFRDGNLITEAGDIYAVPKSIQAYPAVTEDVTEQVIEYQTTTMTHEQKIEQNEELKKEMGSDFEKRKGETRTQWFERRKEYYINWKKRTK